MNQIQYCGSPHLCTITKCKNRGCILNNPSAPNEPAKKGTIDAMIKSYWDRMAALGITKPTDAELKAFVYNGISLKKLKSKASSHKKRRFESLIDKDGLIPCHYCNTPIAPKFITRDHKVPASILRKGPRLTTEEYQANIVPSCFPCNQKKGVMSYDEFIDRENYLNEIP